MLISGSLDVNGPITATTLIVQTITSSVDFVTGSTRFGSILGNTHVFSGSVTMNPGGLFVTSSGLVGIGNVVPAYTLDVSGTLRNTTSAYFATTSGNVGIGTTSANKLGADKALTINGATDSLLELTVGDVRKLQMYHGGTNAQLNNLAAGSLTLITNGISALTLASTGASTFTTTSGLGITITTNDVATLKMTNSAGSTKTWGFATTNIVASDFGIYQSTSNGDDPVSAGASRLYFNGAAYTKITNNGSLISRSAPFHEIYSSLGGNCLVINNANTTGAITSIDISYSGQTISDASSYFWIAYDTLQTKAVVYSNGTFGSRTNTYGSMSDIKLKENIVSATPKLEDLLKVNIVNFNFIDDTNKLKQIGVIAQELEQIFPNMIYETIDKVTGENSKNVKYSIFVPMIIKAMQEQQALITSLQSRIETLESK
jgi:hypothetical protein